MPLNKDRLQAHLLNARKAPVTPALPKTPAIKAVEKIEQDVKKATGVSKVEREVTSHTNNLDSSPDVKAVAEQSLSKALMKRLLSGEKLSTEDQKQIAAVCKVVEYL